MSRYVNIDQIIADIYEKWGCDPAYYVGVSGADAHEAKLDADLIEFLQSKPSMDIVCCKNCTFRYTDIFGHDRCRVHMINGIIFKEDSCSRGKEKSQ